MNIKMTKYLIIITLLFVVSCHVQDTPKQSIKSVTLISEKLLKDTAVIMKYPYKIKVQDSLMILWDLHGADKFFHFFSYPGLKFLTSVGNKGRGDNEFVNTGGFLLDGRKLYIFDAFSASLYTYSLDSLLHRIDKPLEVIHYPAECIPVLAFTKVDQKFALLNFDGKKRITFVDNKGDVLEKKYDFPADEESKLPTYQNFLASLWDSFLDYNPCNKTLGVVTKLGEVLEIYNLEDSTAKVIVGKDGKPDILKKDGAFSIGKKEGFSDIQVKDEAIYALYSGLDRAQLLQQQKEGKSTPEGGKYIYVYDLEGELKKIYELDKYINGFDIHEEEKVIYAIGSGDEDMVVKYRLPEG